MRWRFTRPAGFLWYVFPVTVTPILLILAFPGFGFHYFVWVGLVPLFMVIRRSGLLGAILSSLVAGYLFFSGIGWWLLKLDGMNLFSFSLLALGTGAGYFAAFGFFVHYFRRKIPRWNVLTFPAIWVVLEYLRTHLGFLSHHWGILGYSQYSVIPVARISAYAGVYGVSFIIVAVNTAITEMILSHHSPKWGNFPLGGLKASKVLSYVTLAGVFIMLTVPLIAIKYISPDEDIHKDLKVAIVQGGTYPQRDNYAQNMEKALLQFRRHSLDAAYSKPELIVWPESSVPGRIPFDSFLVKMLSRLARETNSYLLLGTSRYDKFDRRQGRRTRTANSAFLFSPGGKIVGSYDKMILLPFFEYLPLRGYLKWPSWIVPPGLRDFQPGSDIKTFKAGRARFGVAICWENMFPEHFRKVSAKGVDFMVSMMNESFSDVPDVHNQAFAINVFRAVENHVPIVRAALNGVSTIIGPEGRIVVNGQNNDGINSGKGEYMVGLIPLISQRTIYNRYGDWLVYLLFIFLIGIFVKIRVAEQKSQKEQANAKLIEIGVSGDVKS